MFMGSKKEQAEFKRNTKAKVSQRLQKKVMQYGTCKLEHLALKLFKLVPLCLNQDQKGDRGMTRTAFTCRCFLEQPMA